MPLTLDDEHRADQFRRDLREAIAKRPTTPRDRTAARQRVLAVRQDDSRPFRRAITSEIERAKRSAADRIAGTLQPTLIEFIKAFLADEARRTARKREAQEQASVAEEIAKEAADLRDLIEHHRPVIRRAQQSGYLAPDRRYARPTLGDVVIPVEDHLGRALATLIADLIAWQTWTAYISRRGPGAAPVGDRILLAEFAAFVLIRHELPLRKTRDGVYDGVVRAMYKFAGLPQTASFSDIRAVLDDDRMKGELEKLRVRISGTRIP
jgi:hypothetical protein